MFSSFILCMMQCIINGFGSDSALSGSNYSIPVHLLNQHNFLAVFSLTQYSKIRQFNKQINQPTNQPTSQPANLVTSSVEQIPLWQATTVVLPLIKKFPTFYGTHWFIAVFTRAFHSPYPEPDKSSPFSSRLF
jgi:hypothetical protein